MLMQGSAYDFARLEATLLEWIATYRASGKEDWAKLLEGDLALLREREKQRPASDAKQRANRLQQENERLQQQIDQLRAALNESGASSGRNRRVVRYDTSYYYPYSYLSSGYLYYPYYLYYYYPNYCQPAGRPLHPPAPAHTHTAPVGGVGTGTSAGSGGSVHISPHPAPVTGFSPPATSGGGHGESIRPPTLQPSLPQPSLTQPSLQPSLPSPGLKSGLER
jgi:hypothetical protein